MAHIGMSVTGDLQSSLSKFAQKVQEKAVRAGTYAVAESIYREMKLNARKGAESSGRLANAIYTFYDKDQSAGGQHVYAVGVNKRKAGNWHWIEYGRWRHYQTVKVNGKWVTLKDRPLDTPVWVPPTPYMRPAYDAKITTAYDVFKQGFKKAMGDP